MSPGAEARHGDSRVPAGKPQCIYPDPWPSAGKESTCNGGDPGFDSWVGKTPWRRDGLPIPAFLGFPHGSDGKESTCNAGDLGSVPGLGRTPGEVSDNPLQYFCLEDPMDRGIWWATVHGELKELDQSQTRWSTTERLNTAHMVLWEDVECWIPDSRLQRQVLNAVFKCMKGIVR